MRVSRKELRSLHVQRQAGLGQLTLPFINVSDAGPARLRTAGPLGGSGTSPPSEAEDVQERVTHHPVPTMDAAGEFTCTEQAGHIGRAVLVDRHPAVLIMQGRIDEKWLTRRVEAAPFREMAQRRESRLQHPWLLPLQRRGVEKHTQLAIALYSSAFRTFAQDGGGDDIAGLQFVDETFAQPVDELRAGGPGGFRDQSAREMRWVSDPGWMILERVQLPKSGSDAVGEHQAVAGGTVMVRCGETVARTRTKLCHSRL